MYLVPYNTWISKNASVATAVYMYVVSTWLSMLDFPLMLPLKLPVVVIIYSLSNKFAIGVVNVVTGDSKLNESSAAVVVSYSLTSD